MKRSSTRILTTHAGSLVRPPEIVEAMIRDHLREPVDQSAFERDLEAAVSSVVRKQAEIGIDVIDDGEFGKSSWIGYLADRLSLRYACHQSPRKMRCPWSNVIVCQSHTAMQISRSSRSLSSASFQGCGQ